MSTKICSRCAKMFECGAETSKPCWCASLPASSANPNPALDCFCPECLASDLSLPEQPKLIEGEDYYFENGLFVMTALYHIKRGSCCGNACVWCPYEPRHEAGVTKLAAKSVPK